MTTSEVASGFIASAIFLGGAITYTITSIKSKTQEYSIIALPFYFAGGALLYRTIKSTKAPA